MYEAPRREAEANSCNGMLRMSGKSIDMPTQYVAQVRSMCKQFRLMCKRVLGVIDSVDLSMRLGA